MNTGGHLARECFLALAKAPGDLFLVDRMSRRREVRRGFLLALAWMLSRRIGQETNKRRVGIVFPPGMGACVANLAVVLAGKVPVNLNFTLGASVVRACMEKADLDCLLTAEAVRSRMPEFPWPEDVSVLDVAVALRSYRNGGRCHCSRGFVVCLQFGWRRYCVCPERVGAGKRACYLRVAVRVIRRESF